MTIPRTIPMRLRFLALVLSVTALVASAPAVFAQAPGGGSLEQILKAVSAYDGGVDSGALWQLRDYVYARKDDPQGRAECEAALVQYLKTPASPLAKMAACRYLRVIGSDAAVPALAAMLGDVRAADMALYALQQIPGAAADAALVRALTGTGGTTRTAVIAAVGERRIAAAVPALRGLLRQPAYAREAAVALGRIAGEAATAALLDSFPRAAPGLKPVLASALLTSAESALASKDGAAALRLYEIVLADATLPVPLRRAAAMGTIGASGPDASKVLLEALAGSDPVRQDAAIARLSETIPREAIAPVCALVPQLPDGAQVRVLAVLSGYPPPLVRPVVVERARASSGPVRLAALKALESVGGAADVAWLAELAATARGTDQAAARAVLGALKGRAIDEEILALLGRNPPEGVHGELLLAAAERRFFPAKDLVTSGLKSSSARVRQQALRSLRTLGTPSDMAAVLDLLLSTADDAEQAECERTVSALALKFSNPDARSRIIRMRLATEKTPAARARLLAVLPLTADNTALPVVRAALGDADPGVAHAAARALTLWPTAAAREDVVRLARDTKDDTQRLLALVGLVRLVGLEPYRDPAAAVADLKLVADLASRPEERKLVLGALGAFPGPEALRLATSMLADPAVAAEAQAAIERMKQRRPRF